MWVLFLSSFSNFCLASNLLWSFLCFSFVKHFGRFQGNGSHFEKNRPLTAQLHMAYDIPTRFHKVWSRHLREKCRTKMCGRITRIAIASNSGYHPTPLFWYLGFHGNAILNFLNTPKASTHYGEYSYDVSWSLMKEIKIF